MNILAAFTRSGASRIRRALKTVTPVALALSWSLPLAAQQVPFDFNWEEGQARVSVTQTVVQGGMTNDSITSNFSYLMTVSSHPRGWLVTNSEFEFEMGESAMAAMLPPEMLEMQEMMQELTSMQPDFLVSPQGEFLEVTNAEGMMATFQEAMSSVAGLLETMGMGDLAALGLGEDMFAVAARQGWDNSVSNWAGKTFEMGAATTMELNVTNPLLPGMEMPVTVSVTPTESLSCTPNGPAGCVRLESVLVADEAEMTDMMEMVRERMLESIETMMGGAMPGMADIEIEVTDLEVTTVTDMVLDPSTMRPYSTTTNLTTSTSVRAMGMSQTTAQRQYITMTYDWMN